MHNSYLAIVNVATSVVSAVINNLTMFLDDITNKWTKMYIYIYSRVPVAGNKYKKNTLKAIPRAVSLAVKFSRS